LGGLVQQIGENMEIDIRELCDALGVKHDIAKSSAYYLHIVRLYRFYYKAAQQDVQATGLYCQHCGDLMSEHLITERGGACEPPRA
jgi:hypothetical protein